jgi:UDP-glucuronate 4-epimerase
MAHSYSHLYEIPITGLRFFTVYGPYGRPDMAYFKFTKAILSGDPIDVYNFGKMKRDFTYIDDIIAGLIKAMDAPPTVQLNVHSTADSHHKIYNIGNNNPVSIREFITAIELACGRSATENLMPMQPGDVLETYANIDPLEKELGFKPTTSIQSGINEFVKWYLKHNLKEETT